MQGQPGNFVLPRTHLSEGSWLQLQCLSTASETCHLASTLRGVSLWLLPFWVVRRSWVWSCALAPILHSLWGEESEAIFCS
jgi:hypothetical protein